MIKPYIDCVYDDEIQLKGLALTIGYIEDCNCLQIALTIGYTTIAVGLDLGEKYE